MDSCQYPRTVVPLLTKLKTEQNDKLNCSVLLKEQDCSLNTQFSYLPKITEQKHDRKQLARQERQENFTPAESNIVSSRYSSTYSSYLEDRIYVEKAIEQDNKFRTKQEMKQRQEAEIRQAEEKKQRHRKQNPYASDVKIWREKQEREMEKAKILEIKTLGPIEKKALDSDTAKSNEVSGEDKHFKKSLSGKKEQKPNTSHQTKQDQILKQRQKHKRVIEGIRTDFVHDEREKRFLEKVNFQEKCKKMAYENLEDIKRKEVVKHALEEEKFYKTMAKQEFAQKLLDQQERKKKVEMQKSLTDAWDSQVEFKRQKKMEMDKVRKPGSYSMMEPEQFCQTEDSEIKKQKEDKNKTFFRQDETEQNTEDQDAKDGVQYEYELIRHKTTENFNSLEESRKIVYDNLENLKKKAAANFVVLEEKRCKVRAKQQLGQKLLEDQEREKRDNLNKSLLDTWDDQIQYKQQKKKEIAEIEKKQMAAIMDSDRLHKIEEIEESRKNKEKNKIFFRHDDTEPNMEEQKQTVDHDLEDIYRKEAAYDSVLQKKLCNDMAKEKVTKLLREANQQEKKSLADELAAQYQYKQKKKREKDMAERQRVLPGYGAEDIGASRQKKQPQQKLKTQDETKKYMDNPDIIQYHSVTERGRDAQNKSGFLDRDIPEKDRNREIRKKIVYNQLSLLKKEESNKRAFMEDKLLTEMKHREAAEKKRENLEKEKKAAAIKCLTNTWDSQVKLKQKEKKELREIERKDMLSLIDLERVCGNENNKISHLYKHRQPVYHEVQETLPASCSKSCVEKIMSSADRHDAKTSNVCRPLLSRQKVSTTNIVKLPSPDFNSLHLPDNSQQNRKSVRLPSVPRPKITDLR